MVVAGGIGGYFILRRLGEEEQVTPDESMAAECPGGSYSNCIDQCEAGGPAQCPSGQCDCSACDDWKRGCPSACHERCDDEPPPSTGTDCSGKCESDSWCRECAGSPKPGAEWKCQDSASGREDGCEQHCKDDLCWKDGYSYCDTCDPGPSGDDKCDNGDDTCYCESYEGCGSGCCFEGANPGVGQIAMCRNGHTYSYENLHSGHICADCMSKCGGGSCNAGDILVYEGMDGNCGGLEYDYKKTYSTDCSVCGNPIGCLVCCKSTGTSDHYCGDGNCDDGETCEPNGNKTCTSLSIPSGNSCRDDCTFCGDGVLQGGETCEYGDPSGASCPWSTCDHNTCGCPPEEKYLQIHGRVYCQDEEENAPIYPIEGASISFIKSGGGTAESLTTTGTGHFVSAAFITKLAQGPFSVRLLGIPEGTLPTGVAYSDMDGPYLENTSMCSSRCTTCTTDYESCTGIPEEGITYGFRWIYHNCSQVPPNPDWEFEKEGSIVCYEEGTTSVYAQATYVIRVRNIVEGSTGILEYVENYYDEANIGIQRDWIISTVPQATTIDDEKIVWELTGTDREFPYCGDDSCWREFRYTVRMPRSTFGKQVEDHAIGHPEEGEELHAYEELFITCRIPDTGIFDNVVVRIVLGVTLVGLGYAYYRYGLFDNTLAWATKTAGKVKGRIQFAASKEGSKARWEKRIVKNISRKRNKKT